MPFDLSPLGYVLSAGFIYFICRDIIMLINQRKKRNDYKKELIKSEKRIEEKLKKWNKDRNQLAKDLVDLDKSLSNDLPDQPNETSSSNE